MQITQQIHIEAPIDQVWRVLAQDFGDVHQWASAVHMSTASSTPKTSPGQGSKRQCETDLGAFRETVLEFDEKKKIFAYEALGGPPIMRRGVNRWQLHGSGQRTRVSMDLRMELVPVLGFFLGPLMKGQMRKTLLEAGEELKHYVETGAPHPRKIAALAKAQRKGRIPAQAAT